MRGVSPERNLQMAKKLMLAGAVAAAMPLMAETETVGGYTWTYCINSGTA